MISSEIFVISRQDFDLFVIKTNRVTYKVKIFDKEFNVKKELVDGQSRIYVHIEKAGTKIQKLFIDQIMRWEFNFDEEKCRDLISYYKQSKLKTPWEENEMFRNYTVESIEVGEVHPIALKAAIENLIKSGQLQGVTIEKEGEQHFLVKGSSVIALESKEFAVKVEEYVKGKMVKNLGENAVMLAIVKGLGLIKSVTLTKKENSLAEILG